MSSQSYVRGRSKPHLHGSLHSFQVYSFPYWRSVKFFREKLRYRPYEDLLQSKSSLDSNNYFDKKTTRTAKYLQ